MNELLFIVARDESLYTSWQVEILYESFLETYKGKEKINFLDIIMNEGEIKSKKNPTFICPKKYKKIITRDNDYYSPLNRIHLTEAFLKSTEDKERTIVLIDQDFLIKAPLMARTTVAGGQYYWYMDPNRDELPKKVFEFYKKYINKEGVENYYLPIGAPLVFQETILRKIINRWFKLTYFFRYFNKQDNPLYKNWICEMYGIAFALAEYKIHGSIINEMSFCLGDNQINPSFYHFCYSINDSITNNVIFDKRKYKPWELIQLKNKHVIGEEARQFIHYFNSLVNKLKLQNER